MPNISTSKNSSKNQNWGTVESRHKEYIEHFDKRRGTLPEKKCRMIKLRGKLDKLDLDENERRQINENVKEMQTEIDNIEGKTDEYKYYLDTGPTLFKYYEHLENPTVHKPRHFQLGNRRGISRTGDGNTCRFKLLDDFLSINDPNWVRKSKSNKYLDEAICQNCKVLKNLNYRESIYVCPVCAEEQTTFIDSDRPSYKDPPPEVNYFAYKRINHFNELLAQFQAKESTHIPQDVFSMIKQELKKERKTVKDLNFDLVKRYLKKHSSKKYNQYYDHIFHIINRLNGDKPLNMTPTMENNFRYLFLKIQKPFDKYCPKERKNFISYNFVFYKFCEMLGYREFLKYFPLLKSKDKLYEQEKIWEKICADIGLD